MVWLFVFLSCGIIFGRFFGLNGVVVFTIASIAAASLCFAISRRYFAFVLPIFAVLGVLTVHNAVTPQSEFLENVAYTGGFVRVQGQVEDISLTRTGRQRVRINTSQFTIAPTHQIYDTNMGIMAYLPEGAYVQMGQFVIVSGYLQLLDPPRNPGGFNQFQFLRSRGIEYRLFAESVSMYEAHLTLQMRIRGLGLYLSDSLHNALPEQTAGILAAMIVGDRSGLDADTRALYSSIGMFHILVVSGLHVNILALAFGLALQKFGVKNAKLRGLATIGFIVFFVILTGAGIATQRAGIMGIVFALAGVFGFQKDTTTSLALAGAILLLIQPLFLFDLGFIYSFTMVVALVYVTPAIERVLELLSNRFARLNFFTQNWFVRKYFAFNFAAVLVYMLINSFIFFEFSPYSLLANLIIMPTVAITLVFGLLAAIFGLFSPLLAQIFAFPAWVLTSFYEIVMRAILSLPGSVILTGRPHFATLSVLGAGMAACTYIIMRSKLIIRHLSIAVGAIALSLVTIGIINATNPTISTTFLYVGQGNSAVMHHRREALIIDGGGVFGREIGENVGAFTLMPYLDYRGISQAAALVTHNHRDHALGIVEALIAGRVNHLIMAHANSNPGNTMYDLLTYHATSQNVPITYVTTGDKIALAGMTLYILYPGTTTPFGGHNDNSIVIRAVHGNSTILFTGDIEAPAENYILQTGANLNAHVLQIAHHGSRTSTTQEFLSATNPQIAIISAGRGNMFNHPHPSVTNRLTYNNIPYFNTATNGAITIRTTPQNIRMEGRR